ncbi:hypothetical protein [Parasitella parasitica]|uniref:GST N-terminal domain-containing protein n=1 Tax=Parasitella parasitica TaxID=35722 RepID=A0A0B7N866_9FUNG|nr:hypothetical protein [Parasitella parasitica]
MASTDRSKLTLCGALFCPYVQRTRITLAELGVDYNFEIMDTKSKPSWYLDIFPEGKIPCLIDENSHAIPDSLTIVQYLCERFADKKSLISADLIERADSRYAIEFYGSAIGADYNNYLKTCGEDGSFGHYKMVMNAHLFRLEQLLKAQASGGPYFLGKDFSYADIGMASFVIRMLTFNEHMLDGFKFSALEACPRVAAYFEALISRPSVQETFFGTEEYLSWLTNDHHVVKPTKNLDFNNGKKCRLALGHFRAAHRTGNTKIAIVDCQHLEIIVQVVLVIQTKNEESNIHYHPRADMSLS